MFILINFILLNFQFKSFADLQLLLLLGYLIIIII